MSFILDALKKSELDRQRQAMPGLIDVPLAPRKRRLPVWALVLGALFLVNIAVLSVLLLRAGSKSAAAPKPSQVAAAPAPAAASSQPATAATPVAQGSDHFSPLDNAPVYAPEIPVNEGPPSRKAGPAPSYEESAAPPRTVAQAVRRNEPTLSDADGQDDKEVLPSVNELNLTGAQALPEIHLDVHVYATRAAERFVYINMRKYHEGATLQEGPILEKIRRDGAVLNYRGVRFLLPRQG